MNFFEIVVDTLQLSCVDSISRVARVIARSNEINYQVDVTSLCIHFASNLNTLKDRVAKENKTKRKLQTLK